MSDSPRLKLERVILHRVVKVLALADWRRC